MRATVSVNGDTTFDGFDDPYAPPSRRTYNGRSYTVAKTFKVGSTLPLEFGYKFNGVRVDCANANRAVSICELHARVCSILAAQSKLRSTIRATAR